ncbi:hypothetical protein JOD43_004210 [Pullulanibacillus pueri]|uniref:Uncharacterized protein n=1 Tax=Pullulanibacillus pueri TaxID=1437324 RepID=A0A8J2ZYD7_9BACL|nr:DUF6230 family protein [Pullulanibacillus pueri]MBM7684014.1 hypothetical protein [Pullulanibacillus pueri]GGH85084.1 hypothetical protein GCM10007096_29650 [Pullulanibacillus pueri]
MIEHVLVRGRTVKKRFFIALISGFLFLGALLTFFGAGGVAYAVPIGGVGNFSVTFDKLVGDGFKLYGGLGESGEAKQTPIFVNELDHATIYGLHIAKDFSLPGMGTLRVNITSDKPVKITGLIQKARTIRADAEFNKMTMKENYVGDVKDPIKKVSKEFTQDSQSITLKNGSLDTTYLFQKAIELPGLKVSFQHIDSK